MHALGTWHYGIDEFAEFDHKRLRFSAKWVVGQGFTWLAAHGGLAASCLSLTAGLGGSTVPWVSLSAPQADR